MWHNPAWHSSQKWVSRLHDMESEASYFWLQVDEVYSSIGVPSCRFGHPFESEEAQVCERTFDIPRADPDVSVGTHARLLHDFDRVAGEE